jgi:predicted enzyme related to lactoylglutathione lyase
MSIRAQSLAGIVLHSEDPARLAAFYKDALGVAVEPVRHGHVGDHFEGMVGQTHVAIWKPMGKFGVFVPVLRVADVDAASAALRERGVEAMHAVLDIGEGKRVATFRDPDGHPVRLIQIG